VTPALQQARKTRVTALAILVAIGVLAIAFLFSPWGDSRTARQIERDTLFRKVRTEETAVAPLRDIDKKIALAQEQISTFEDRRLPAEYSAISEALGGLAAENKVQISGIKYDPAKEDEAGLRRIGINASVAAPYPAIMRFINGMERSKVLFVIKGVSLQEQSAGGEVRLQISCETYMRSKV